MIEWKPEAIVAGFMAYKNTPHGREIKMRAALDAAVKAQGLYCDGDTAFAAGYAAGRAEAFEEAAKMCDGNSLWTNDECAASIRGLAKEPPK